MYFVFDIYIRKSYDSRRNQTLANNWKKCTNIHKNLHERWYRSKYTIYKIYSFQRIFGIHYLLWILHMNIGFCVPDRSSNWTIKIKMINVKPTITFKCGGWHFSLSSLFLLSSTEMMVLFCSKCAIHSLSHLYENRLGEANTLANRQKWQNAHENHLVVYKWTNVFNYLFCLF